MNNECQSPQENNVSECLPKKFDKKAYYKAWYEANKEKRKAYEKAYAEEHKRDRRAYHKAYHEKNKNREKEISKVYREINKNNIKEYKENYRKNNGEKIKEYAKFYRKENKNKISKFNKIYRKRKREEDPLFAAKEKLRKCVYHSFRRIAQNKPTDTQTLLGCSWQEAREHFERLFKEGMTWENHGEWHIDHIRPVSSFAEDELHLMNHISNLQPLWEDENLSKSNK